jgi:hypothetical protein
VQRALPNKGTLRFVIAAILLAAAIVVMLPAQPDPLAGSPRIFLWAWERPENLTFLHPHEAGVAFLTRTVILRHGEVLVRPRFQPLRVAAGTALVAVVRVESDGSGLPQAPPVARAITGAAREGVVALQVDYDAPVSERSFYRTLLTEIRKLLPARVPLSMTALVSWCSGDDWLDGLPVAEAVPMLFRMGPSLPPGRDFRSVICRQSLGVSTDELPGRVPAGRRVYVFHPRPWTAETARAAVREVERWQSIFAMRFW